MVELGMEGTDREAAPATPETPEETSDQLLAESLVEEVSIDGMCGVY